MLDVESATLGAYTDVAEQKYGALMMSFGRRNGVI